MRLCILCKSRGKNQRLVILYKNLREATEHLPVFKDNCFRLFVGSDTYATLFCIL